MDEADILSDNVAILDKGKLLCFGSPLLLKSKFGCGYQLTISRDGDRNSSFKNGKLNEENIKILVTDYDKENQLEDSCLDQLNVTDSDSGRVSNNSIQQLNNFNGNKLEKHFISDELNSEDKIGSGDKLMQFIRCLIPNALKLDENHSEIIIALPKTSLDGTKHDYSTFFQCLDSNISRFGFYSYGLTSTTLEEIFLTLCSLQDSRLDYVGSLESKLNLAKKINLSTNSFYSNNTSGKDDTLNNEFDFYNDNQFANNSGKMIKPTSKNLISTGLKLKLMQFNGLIKKRAYHTFTNWRTLFYNLIFPCLFIIFALGMTTIKPHLAPDPILPLSPSIYGSEATSFYALKQPYQFDSNNLTTSYFLTRRLDSDQWKDDLECGEPRKGWKVSKCPVVKKSFKTEFPSYLLNISDDTKEENQAECECEQCYDYTGQVNTPILTSAGYVYDLSNVSNLNYFLMKTYPLFNERRYGGWTVHNSTSMNDNDEYLASDTNKEVWKVWFDNNGQHSIPSYLNTLNNAILRANLIKFGGLSEQEALDYSINSYSHPFHIRSAQLGDQRYKTIIILISFSMCNF